jgi:large subunit ribosomal protein L17
MRKLNKYTEHRLSMLKNLCISLINEKSIITTLMKAKELKKSIEPLITRAKTESLANRRILLSRLHNNENAVRKLFQIGQSNDSRAGGYIRVLRCGTRNDGAVKAYVEIINYPENQSSNQES